MLIHYGYKLVFDLPVSTSMIALLYTHPDISANLRKTESLKIDPEVPVEDFIDIFGNRCARFTAPAGRVRLWSDNILHASEDPDPVNESAIQQDVNDLPVETLQFLLPSRYCEVDLLSDIAWTLFGDTVPGWARVQAICDWVNVHVKFGYEHARSTKTAREVYQERAGVCRDLQHLAITFCRCLNIPARYATGYLGDIRVPREPNPMDFSAWFEAYLGGQWYAFDARFNTPRIGRTLMARGRDAVDVALTTSFGQAALQEFTVWTEEIPA
ncbi:MAG TPA: transglutaminase family protein [Armatimonadota bacterium]|nr:transglutaminase family protein [Armatimonadota bacterium]